MEYQGKVLHVLMIWILYPLLTTTKTVKFGGINCYHLSSCWHLDSKHIQASAAAAVPALLIVYMNGHFLVRLQHKGIVTQ